MSAAVTVFDAYGTLFDVAGAARMAATQPGNEALATLWPKLAEDWRQKQLSYSWLTSLMGVAPDFWQITEDALDWALDAAGLASPTLRGRLLALYRNLPAYPEVPAMLARLRAQGRPTAILSNGTPRMLADAIRSAGLVGQFDTVLSVDSVGIFKPHPSVYAMVPDTFGCRAADVLFVSSNGWDVAGAARFGFRVAWINRASLPPDRLPGSPAHIIADLTPIPDLAEAA